MLLLTGILCPHSPPRHACTTVTKPLPRSDQSKTCRQQTMCLTQTSRQPAGNTQVHRLALQGVGKKQNPALHNFSTIKPHLRTKSTFTINANAKSSALPYTYHGTSCTNGNQVLSKLLLVSMFSNELIYNLSIMWSENWPGL